MIYKRLGDYIQPVNIRNKELAITTLLGVSVKKVFIPSIANTVGTDFKKYKIVKKKQFVYIPDTSRRGDKIGIAMLEEYENALVSQAYSVFEIKDQNKLLSEYLMMWFRRPEFDRYARYKSHGSVREIFDWDEVCDIELPIPSIEKQQQIVAEYNTVNNRIQLNEKINANLEATTQALYKHWFVDFEFPYVTSSGVEMPYKSSGGEMVYNEELDKEIPEEWSLKRLVDISKIKGGKRMPSGSSLIKNKTNHTYIKVADLGKYKYVQFNDKFEFVPEDIANKISRYITHKNDVIISIVGTIGVVKILGDSLDGANLTENCMKITELKKISPSYLYHYLVSKEGKEEIQIRNVGAVQAKLPMYNIESLPILIPSEFVLKKFNELIYDLDKKINTQIFHTKTLQELQSLLLAKMTKAEA